MNDDQQIVMLSLDDRSVTTNLDVAGYRKMGVTVKTATTWEDVEATLKDECPDVLVINLDYRRVDGVQVVRHIRSSPIYSTTPIVVTSVQSGAMRSAAIKAGADLFVEQPVPRQLFIEKLKTLLSKSTRSNTRVGARGDARFSLAGQPVRCDLADVSTSGLFLVCDLAIETGSQIKVKVTLPGLKKAVEVSGTVVRRVASDPGRADSPSGYGFKIETFHGDARKVLEKFVATSSESEFPLRYYL